MNDFILTLGAAEAVPELAGGKGTNLSQLARAGFSVPPGFIITTAAYRAFVQTNELEGRIAAHAANVSQTDPASFEHTSQTIRQLFDQGPMPPSVAAAIQQAYGDLLRAVGESLTVAVRSSATAEDLPEASFAGQHETRLNVRGEQALLVAVKRCWSSLWMARAIAYRAWQGIPSMAIRLAVVVQQMVPAEAAGILFTVNPVSGNRDEVVINAAWGLGEADVAGWVMPDTVLADKVTGRVKQMEIGNKAIMIVPAAEGTVEIPVDPERSRAPVLIPEQVSELARLGRAIEAHFGDPQDIEWAIAGGRVYILQSRPVTALPGQHRAPYRRFSIPHLLPKKSKGGVLGDDDWPAEGEQPAQPFDLWTRAGVGEAWPQPVTPLIWSMMPALASSTRRSAIPGHPKAPYLDNIQWMKRFYGRVYWNEGARAYVFHREFGLPDSMGARTLGSRLGTEHRRKGFQYIRFLRSLPILVHAAFIQRSPSLEILAPQIDRWVADFQGWMLTQFSDRELLAELMNWRERWGQMLSICYEINGLASQAVLLLEWLLRLFPRRRDLTHDLMIGLTGIYTAEMGPALWRMAQALRTLGLGNIPLTNSPAAALAQLQQTPAARSALQMLDAFLQRHGHRCPNEADWLYPRWAEAPEQVIEMLARYLQAGDQINLADAEARQRQRREQTTAWVEGRLDPIRRAIFRMVLSRAQDAVRGRDNSQYYFVKIQLPLRRMYAEIGRRWAANGWLRQSEDVFFLIVGEIERVIHEGNALAAGLNLPTIVARRRTAYEYWFGVSAPEVLGPDGQPLMLRTSDGQPAGVLQGIPASGGRVRGRAHLIFDPRAATRLQTGDILVTLAMDPGWTPLLFLAGGVVLEIGGQLSHAAILAREYGLPAVVSVRGATQLIQDGQTITVDGTVGRVYLEGD